MKEKRKQRNTGRTHFKKGHVVTKETREKISEAHLGMKKPWALPIPPKYGSENFMWKGGVTPINEKIRKSHEYKLWRNAVYERDNYTCIWCGKRGGKLHADHIKPFAYYPELRFAIDNGRTLCIECHRTTETYGERVKKL